jgi:hypothetical protein
MDRHKHQNTIIRVSPDVFEELRRLTELTRRPIGEITSEALRFALGKTRMIEVKAYDVAFGEEKKEGTK